MASNDQIILEQILRQQEADMEVKLLYSDLFERFAADQALKNYYLSDDEIEEGIVGGGNDGGVDSVYAFVNEDLINIDTDISVVEPHYPVKSSEKLAKMSSNRETFTT